MSEPVPDRSEFDILEDMLKASAGDELVELVDLVSKGIDATDFRNSPQGKAITKELTIGMTDALEVLVDYQRTADHGRALRSLQVNYAALHSIAGAIARGRIAERNIVNGVGPTTSEEEESE